MHFVSFSQLGSAAASLQAISLVTPEKKIKTDSIGHRYRSAGTGFSNLRSQVLLLNADIGSLSWQMYHHAPMDPYRPRLRDANMSYPPTLAEEKFWSVQSTERDAIYDAIALVFWDLVAMAELSGFNLRTCILKKMELNRKKYKAELCKGKSGKYTDYSAQTGITKTEGQSTLHIITQDNIASTGTVSTDDTSSTTSTWSVKGMSLFIRDFALEREWQEFHTPRNILHAIIGEMGEMAELFQWRGDYSDNDKSGHENCNVALSGWTDDSVDHLQQEIADVAIYLLRLADVCCIDDLGAITLRISQTMVAN